MPTQVISKKLANTRLEILTSNWAKLFRPRRVWAHVHKQIKMASQNEPDQEQLFNGIKGALKRQKSKFERQISNVHKFKDLDETFNALEKLAEAVVQGKYGPLRLIDTSMKSVMYIQCWNAQR